MLTLLEEIAKFLFWIIVEIFFVLTGEIVLFLVSFGKHRLRWDLYTDESTSKFVVFSELSMWIGLGFWLLLIYIMGKII